MRPQLWCNVIKITLAITFGLLHTLYRSDYSFNFCNLHTQFCICSPPSLHFLSTVHLSHNHLETLLPVSLCFVVSSAFWWASSVFGRGVFGAFMSVMSGSSGRIANDWSFVIVFYLKRWECAVRSRMSEIIIDGFFLTGTTRLDWKLY